MVLVTCGPKLGHKYKAYCCVVTDITLSYGLGVEIRSVNWATRLKFFLRPSLVISVLALLCQVVPKLLQSSS